MGFKTTQLSSSTKSILPNEAFYIIYVSGDKLTFSSSVSLQILLQFYSHAVCWNVAVVGWYELHSFLMMKCDK